MLRGICIKVATIAGRDGEDSLWVPEMRARIALREGKVAIPRHGKVEAALEFSREVLVAGY